jgi:dTDP-4-amino-4,6-dideoxygalactose transaminase
MSFDNVERFESEVARFYNAPYAVATDCCTHAIELCLRYTKAQNLVLPSRTYLSVPFTLEKLGLDWVFEDEEWQDYYYLGNTNIIDAAVYWKEAGYILGTFMCLSFQFQKHLSLGRGGMILTDNKEAAIALKKMSYDGRLPDIPWRDQDIDSVGYHYYMTPETATLGLSKLDQAKTEKPRKWSVNDWPDLRNMSVFKHKGL